MEDDDYGTPPPAPNRSIDVELSGQEIVAIDLDTLDSDPQDYIDLLLEAKGNATVSMWTRLACEYCKSGLYESAEKCLEAAVNYYRNDRAVAHLASVHQLLANIQLARARKAPKIIIENARQDNLTKERAKEFYLAKAARQLNYSGEGGGANVLTAILIRGMFQLAKADLEDAMRSFTVVLSKQPTNIIALLGKARIAYSRKQYAQALRTFQQVLQLKPDAQPDPRIGIGLCLWALDQKAKAKACWERSLEVHPSNWSACLLLGLEAINSSKNPDDDDAERTENFIRGTKYCEKAFKLNNRNAAAANVLFDLFLQRGDRKVSLKLAERTIQFAETLALFSAGHIHAGHLAQMENSTSDAVRHFNAALKGNPKNVLAAIGLAQTQMKIDEISAAIHTLDTLMQPPNPQRCLEVTVLLGSLRARPRPGISSADAQTDRQKARELLEPVLKALNLFDTTNVNGHGPRTRSKTEEYIHRKAVANFGDDVELLVEAARLWQDENRPRMRRLLEEAVRVVQERVQGGGAPEPRLLNNLAVLKHNAGELVDARAMYEAALTEASAMEGPVGEGMATTILYNLGRVYEDQGETAIAKDAYDKLLSRHPEYTDAKVRLAQLLVSLCRYDEAHEWLKSALTSQKSNLNLRSALAHFLISRQQLKLAREFLTQTLKENGSHDVYSLCIMAWIFFNQGRENRDPSPTGVADRKKNFLRATEFYERALQFDPKCAIAAQGLAIIAAEDCLGPIKAPAPGMDDGMRRMQGAREALDIFGKVRESMNDSSVYVNMGHCYFVRDEFDRAIESYETAAKRCAAGSGPDITVLQNLCRAWYAKAIKDQSFVALRKALHFAQRSLHLAPQEKASMYNLAMIEQKAAELLLGTQPAKRTLVDLKRAIEHGLHAQQLFGSLAIDKAASVPYSKEIADQRRKYGEGILRRADEQVAIQEQHEAAQEARLAEARQRRLDEKKKAAEAAETRAAELEVKAHELAIQRRKAREEALEWTKTLQVDSDEEREKEKKAKKAARKQKIDSEPVSGDDGPAPSAEGKKKRKGKLRRDKEQNGETQGSGSEEEAIFSGEDEDKPKKRLQKKRVVRDDDDEEVVSSAPRKKQFKSKETISDSDEDMA